MQYVGDKVDMFVCMCAKPIGKAFCQRFQNIWKQITLNCSIDLEITNAVVCIILYEKRLKDKL